MGGSGCGKKYAPEAYDRSQTACQGGNPLWGFQLLEGGIRQNGSEMMRHVGVLYQSGALWSSMTLAENVALPLQQYTKVEQGENQGAGLP